MSVNGSGERGSGETVSIVVPCYNEAGNIGPTIDDLAALTDRTDKQLEIIVVNDGSKDDSWSEIKRHAVEHANVIGIDLMKNCGQTLAYQAGFDAANGDDVLIFSADRETPVEAVLEVIAKLDEGYDFVNTWRKGRWNATRAVKSVLANALINWISTVKLKDRGSGLKGMRGSLTRQTRMYGEMHRFLPDYASIYTDRFIEIETEFKEREAGASAYSGRSRTLSVLLDLLTLWFILGGSRKPFSLLPGRVFGFVGLIVGTIGFIVTAYLSISKLVLGITLADRPLFLGSVLFMILGILMTMIGMIGEQMLHRGGGGEGVAQYIRREVIGDRSGVDEGEPR